VYSPPDPNPLFNQSDLVVTVETDSGIMGIGEGGSRDMLEQCAGRLIGQDPNVVIDSSRLNLNNYSTMVELENDFEHSRRLLGERLREPAPGRIQLLTGPRQVGKTTLLLELAREFGELAIYIAGDEPDAALPGFWERCWTEAEARAQRGTAALLLDEIHHLPDWAARLKGQWDRLRRRHLPLHVVATGSSTLRVATGSRESLAGRFERMTLSHWPAAALASTFHLSAQDAALSVVQFGSYPGAMEFNSDLARWRAYVREAIIEPAIGRDVLALGAVRRPALLRQVFAITTVSPAQIVSLQKLQGQLQDKGALETVAHYLTMLQEGYLVASLEKFGSRVHRRRSAPPKLVTLNNAVLSAMHPDGPPDPAKDPARFGAWVENACLAFAVNQGQRVTYWREEPLEIDAVFEGSWGNWAVEVKTGSFDVHALKGLLEFCRRNPKFIPLVITGPRSENVPRRHGIRGLSWEEFLVSGTPR
jgi:predicted AAA+ superfamily ATPase